MKTPSKIWIGVGAVVVIIGVICATYCFTQNKTQAPILTTENNQNSTSSIASNSNNEKVSATEKATGLIKSVYTLNGKNYINIDYVELNPNWAPGGNNGPASYNNNPKIRTFEIASNAKFTFDDPGILPNFESFKNFFINKSNEASNPWDIVVVGGAITEITEHYFP